MSHKRLKNYQDFLSPRIKSSWTKCTVGLEHSVSGEYYWLNSEVRFFAEGEPELLVHLRGGDKNDPKIIFSTLEAQGINQVN